MAWAGCVVDRRNGDPPEGYGDQDRRQAELLKAVRQAVRGAERERRAHQPGRTMRAAVVVYGRCGSEHRIHYVFGIFAALAEFERELIRERTLAGLKSARARGRKGGRKFALSKAQVRLAQAAMAHRDTSVAELCSELGIRPVTLYRYVGPQGQLREQGEKVLAP